MCSMNRGLHCAALSILSTLATCAPDVLDVLGDEAGSSCSFLQTKLQAQKASQPEHFWSGKNGDLLRTGYSPHVVKSLLEPGPDWSFEETENSVAPPSFENAIVRAAPVIDKDENIYLASVAGYLRKFSRNGTLLWKYTARRGIPAVPALTGNAVFIATHAGEVVALDVAGNELWATQAGNASASDTWSLAAGHGVVVAAVISSAGLMNDLLVALDANTGQIKWSFRPDYFMYNFLGAIKDGSLVFSDSHGAPYRLDLQTGELIWKNGPAGSQPIEAGMTTGGAIVGPNGVVYVTSNAQTLAGSTSGYATAFNFADGERLWRAATEYAANNAASIGEIVNGRLGLILGIGDNPDPPLPLLAGTVIPDDAPSLKEKKARVLALDAASGEELWRKELLWHGWAAGDRLPSHMCLPDSFSNAAIGGDGTAYIGFQSGAFFAIRDKDGDGKISEGEMSTYNFHNSFQGSPGIAPGMLVATPCNGMHVFLS
eukprot:gb/GFBE01064264.1/.p1 GENE.gb/GFBE01064264.1/~~gb/GFBE01064264.1/.p1  ORF type:complete len:486 (+),score=89.14 gb/GFBE01064264.1/:1-1458(+)